MNPWFWLRDIVCTWDNHDPSTIFKPWPKKAMYRVIARVWLETDILFIEKSRQIMMTWVMAALFLWDSITQFSRLVLLQSKKQDDANDILERVRHIYIAAHEYKIPWLPEAKKTASNFGTASSIEFPKIKSEIRAIPQGADVVRMHTCSGIFGDEMNHQPEFQEGYGAAKPTIDGGGKYVAGGTANGHTFGWMQLQGIDPITLESYGPRTLDSADVREHPFYPPEHLTTDGKRRWIEQHIVNMPEDEFNAIPLHELIAAVPGMRYWVTAHGVTCLRVHYSADPDKSRETEIGRAWYKKAREGTPDTTWDREMEIKYDVFDAQPVIGGFTRELYASERIEYRPDCLLYLAIDFGQKCGCIFFQVYNIKGHNVKRVKILHVIFYENSDTLELRDAILQQLNGRFYESWKNGMVRPFSDAAGNQGRETTSDKSLKTSNGIMAASGIFCTSKKVGVKDGVMFVQSMFSRILPDGKPAVLVDPSCEYLLECYEGGWHFPKASKTRPGDEGRPEKDGYYEHGGDMTVYGINNVLNEYDMSDKPQPGMSEAPFKRRRHTGEIIGRIRPDRINRRRGVHAVRDRI